MPQGDLAAGREDAPSTARSIRFKPDAKIFEEHDVLASTPCRTGSASWPSSTRASRSSSRTSATSRSHTFLYKGGIIEFIKHLNQNKTPIHPKVLFFEGKKGDIEVEVALQYNDGYQESVFSFANNINTREGGTHLTGFRAALTGTHRRPTRRPTASSRRFKGDDHRRRRARGADAPSSRCGMPDPQFEGQTKAKLGNTRRQGPGRSRSSTTSSPRRSRRIPTTARKIADKCVRAAQAREAARKARELTRKGGRDDEGLAGQARRLLRARPAVPRDLPRRGRLRRRLRQAGPRPQDPGGAAAAGQDHQRREGALRQGPLPSRKSGS